MFSKSNALMIASLYGNLIYDEFTERREICQYTKEIFSRAAPFSLARGAVSWDNIIQHKIQGG